MLARMELPFTGTITRDDVIPDADPDHPLSPPHGDHLCHATNRYPVDGSLIRVTTLEYNSRTGMALCEIESDDDQWLLDLIDYVNDTSRPPLRESLAAHPRVEGLWPEPKMARGVKRRSL